ncbi:LOW QUALITY PROTEIN: calpain-13 [Neomonachus schauinslandi]|uniref:LOW QUALITY PROTEIN: calpain-13 n=1 Tax=Neomonachus schauinslandi TaxID=29088 RepID=A0A2Y9HP65_NEOSC|nr:LOW QUALITY PROTEIN: calpain-13 [Neomonachus schauinslandi]
MAYNQEPLDKTPVIKFNSQDFNSLQDCCLSRSLPFEDETFPAEASSIGLKLLQEKNLSSLRWMRPKFWQCGQWVEVVVDDHLPVLDKEYLFVHPHNNNQEFWPCLLEKAYAKFHGSYANLHYGFLPAALVDLTGGAVTSIDLHFPSDLVMMVKTAAKAGSLMACATLAELTGEARRMENGLVSQHAYTVTGAERIQYGRSWEDLIRLWNPWGNTEWRGRWSDGSLEWQKTHGQRKANLYENKEDGEFWMSCQDFQDNFSCLFICNQFPVSLNQGNMPHEIWSQMMFKNHATPGNTTGYDIGRPSGTFQPFWKRLPPTFFSQFRNAIEGIVFKTKSNLTKYFSLSTGTYMVVTSAHSEAVGFLLRTFLKMPDGDRNLGSNFNLTALRTSLPENGSQESIFHRYDQQGLNMDATQLQSLLSQELLKGTPGDTFSLDECRSIVALMDLKVNGWLDQEQFARLWGRLVHCQSVFQNTQNRSGVFLSLDLWKAIKDTDFLAGTSISNELLDLMTLRYSENSGRVSFPSLVCLLLRLEAMEKTFRNLSKDGKRLYLTEMKWMNLVMYN